MKKNATLIVIILLTKYANFMAPTFGNGKLARHFTNMKRYEKKNDSSSIIFHSYKISYKTKKEFRIFYTKKLKLKKYQLKLCLKIIAENIIY